MTDVNITITVDAPGGTAHVCGGMCDCPKAIARAQEAIDTDRAQHGREPRALGERIRGMRNAAPAEQWFDTIAYQADRLTDLLDRERGHTEAANARILELQSRAYQAASTIPSATQQPAPGTATPLPVATNMHAALVMMLMSTVEHTLTILELAELLPKGHRIMQMTDGARLYAGALMFVARVTDGEVRESAGQFAVTMTTEPTTGSFDTDDRTTTDLDDVRAWLTAWAVAIVHD